MGMPRIYWYPDGDGSTASLEVTDLAENLSDYQERPIREREDVRTLDGRLSSTVTGASRLSVRIVLERFTNVALARALQTLSAHLERAGHIGFAVDSDKAWAGYLNTLPTRGDSYLNTTGHVWFGSGTLAAGDYLVLEGLGSQGHRELVKVLGTAGTRINLDGTVKYTYTDETVMVRHRWFHPALQWPVEEQRQPLVSSVREIHWTLDVTLHSAPTVQAALYGETGVNENPASGMLGTGGGFVGHTHATLDDSLVNELTERDMSGMRATDLTRFA